MAKGQKKTPQQIQKEVKAKLDFWTINSNVLNRTEELTALLKEVNQHIETAEQGARKGTDNFAAFKYHLKGFKNLVKTISDKISKIEATKKVSKEEKPAASNMAAGGSSLEGSENSEKTDIFPLLYELFKAAEDLREEKKAYVTVYRHAVYDKNLSGEELLKLTKTLRADLGQHSGKLTKILNKILKWIGIKPFETKSIQKLNSHLKQLGLFAESDNAQPSPTAEEGLSKGPGNKSS